MTMYVCGEISQRVDLWGKRACANWVEYTPLFSDLQQLTLDDVSQLWVATLLFFVACYIFKQLPFFIRRR